MRNDNIRTVGFWRLQKHKGLNTCFYFLNRLYPFLHHRFIVAPTSEGRNGYINLVVKRRDSKRLTPLSSDDLSKRKARTRSDLTKWGGFELKLPGRCVA